MGPFLLCLNSVQVHINSSVPPSRHTNIPAGVPIGASGKKKYAHAIESIIIKKVPANATHWSTRTSAESVGTSKAPVSRGLRANGLEPHLVKTFKVSNDPNFEENL